MTDKKLYEIINPSDEVHIEAADQMVACVAILFLGEGKYGLQNEHGESILPLFFFGGHEGWLAQRGVPDLPEYLVTNVDAIADVLDTATLGSARDYAFYKSAVEAIDDPVKREAFREQWDDKKRSSSNNICAAARSLARALRARAAVAS